MYARSIVSARGKFRNFSGPMVAIETVNLDCDVTCGGYGRSSPLYGTITTGKRNITWLQGDTTFSWTELSSPEKVD